MTDSEPHVDITLRIPGTWANPDELLERLPDDMQLTPEGLVLSDGTTLEMRPVPPDDQFAEVFRSACRRPARKEELAKVDAYRVNIVLIGPGGSLEAAGKVMRAAAAIVRAGGAGVFIDNSALAHGGADWLEMADDGDIEAMSFAFTSIIAGRSEVRTMGLHVLGSADIVMRKDDLDPEGSMIIELIRYVCGSERRIGDGHMLGDQFGPRFRVVAVPDNMAPPDSVMHNPFGRLKLVNMKDEAENN